MGDYADPTVDIESLSITRYQDLSTWQLCASDIKSLCKSFLQTSISVFEFSKRHNMPYSTMKRYVQRYRAWQTTGVDNIRDSKAGRPSILDTQGIINIRTHLREAQATQTCQNSMLTQFHLLTETEACETKKRRGLAGADVRVSKKTIKRIKLDNSFVEVQCQFKTHARSFAESDVRNLYSFAIMNEAFVSSVDAAMCFNWDATQYCINAEGHATIVKCGGDSDKPATALSEGGLGFSIKYYHFHNANADVAPAVFIIADDSMGPEDFVYEEVNGLSHTQLVGATGYLIFTKTRNCNAAFYRWYAHHIVAPFVQSCRDSHECKNRDGTPMRAFVVCDGEPSQIQVFQEASVLDLMRDHLIDFGKSPASCSAITQSSDDSDFFKASKKKLVRIRETDYISQGLNRRLNSIISDRKDADGQGRFTSAKKGLICNALQQVVYSIKHVLTPEIVKTGYKRIGQYPVNLKASIGRCTRQVTARDMDIMEQALPAMVEIFRTTGRVTEAQMDAAGIPSVNNESTNSKPKDERPLHQQRSVIMNSQDCIRQYRAHVDRRDAEPARRALALEQREAARIIRDRKAEEVRARKEVKEAEKQRRANLTPEEVKAEAKAKRIANKLARQAALNEHIEQAAEQIIDELENVDENIGLEDLFNDDEIDNISDRSFDV
jgi:hypothetical protein